MPQELVEPDRGCEGAVYRDLLILTALPTAVDTMCRNGFVHLLSQLTPKYLLPVEGSLFSLYVKPHSNIARCSLSFYPPILTYFSNRFL